VAVFVDGRGRPATGLRFASLPCAFLKHGGYCRIASTTSRCLKSKLLSGPFLRARVAAACATTTKNTTRAQKQQGPPWLDGNDACIGRQHWACLAMGAARVVAGLRHVRITRIRWRAFCSAWRSVQLRYCCSCGPCVDLSSFGLTLLRFFAGTMCSQRPRGLRGLR
jgi:hypothetical protein